MEGGLLLAPAPPTGTATPLLLLLRLWLALCGRAGRLAIGTVPVAVNVAHLRRRERTLAQETLYILQANHLQDKKGRWDG